MDVVEKLKRLARTEGLEEPDLLLDEARYFMERHAGHGGYQLQIEYDMGGTVRAIYARCDATNLVDEDKCEHNNPETTAEFAESLLYTRRPIFEAELQAERRTAGRSEQKP